MRFRLLLALLVMVAGPAHAQDGAARYAGDWQVTEGGGGTGMCRVNLATNSGTFGLWATSLGCLGPIAMVNGWRTEGGNLHLLGYDGNPVATFSPNGRALDGRFADGAPAVLAPLSGQNVASNMPAPAQNCIRHPASGYCADASDIAVPTAFPLWVRGAHLLNIRALPDGNSDLLGQTQPNQCFMIDSCQATPDGIRCHIAPGQNDLPTGYVLKHFTDSQGTFIGFQNFC
ncbi:AprI/Inh family metalloprotease inhibitor [Devosia sediminis]|uniref:AprI/Inh family metalloprotease inhibitor n=1 Tax=Devosia sediminis TaxID=2798801 RepID=A0A934MSD1_9HYPH|nr:AprI/Inh family metalloprotease inhibitor [Devosia sediminis]MBJ3786334.1 AprI/Inh family metalloprotease inhibitor [Devosia sediminis]